MIYQMCFLFLVLALYLYPVVFNVIIKGRIISALVEEPLNLERLDLIVTVYFVDLSEFRKVCH